MPSATAGPPLDWDSLYLLGWYDSGGTPYLSSWIGDDPMIKVVVIGSGPSGPPLWDAPIPDGCVAVEIPSDVAPSCSGCIDYATSLGGVYAFGWKMSARPRGRGRG